MASTNKLISITIDLVDKMSGELSKTTSNLERMGATMTKVGATMTAAITVPFAAMATTGVKASMELETSLKNLQTISTTTDEQLVHVKNSLLDMSTNMKIGTDTAQNLADTLYDINSSGFSMGADWMVLTAATKAASAGLTETRVAAEGMVAVLNSYGMSASEATRVSDLMFMTVNKGVGSFEQLTSSLGNVTGLAAALDIPFETVSAAIATVSKQGNTFAESTVQINAALSDLIKPTKAGQEMILAMGYASGEAMLQALGFAGSLEAISEHTGGSVTEMTKLFGSINGLRGALALTGDNAAMFADDLAAMNNSAGATQAAFDIQMQSFEARLKNFQNTWMETLIRVGDAVKPIIGAILSVVTPMLAWFNDLNPSIQTVIVGFVALLAAVGPVLIIAGQIAGALAALGGIAGIVATATGVLTGAMTALGAVMTVITGPIGLAIIAIAALAVAFDKISGGKVSAIPKVWGENFRMLGEIISLATEKAVSWGSAFIGGFIEGMKKKIAEAVATVINFAMKIHNAIKSALKIQSPSKVMMKLGQNVVAGFNQGIESFGGIGVQVPALAGAGTSVSSTPASGNSGGGNFYMYGDIHVPPGTTQEQIHYISRELAKKAKRRGARGQ